MSLTLNFRSFHHNFLNAVLTGACLVLAGLNLKLATHTLGKRSLPHTKWPFCQLLYTHSPCCLSEGTHRPRSSVHPQEEHRTDAHTLVVQPSTYLTVGLARLVHKLFDDASCAGHFTQKPAKHKVGSPLLMNHKSSHIDISWRHSYLTGIVWFMRLSHVGLSYEFWSAIWT